MKASRYNISVSDGDGVHAARTNSMPGELAARILAPGDWNFILRQTSTSVQQTFRRERKTIHLSWLRQMRQQVAQLMKSHRPTARPFNLHLSLAAELKLLGHAAVFYAMYAATLVVIQSCGPARAASLMTTLAAVVERLRFLSEEKPSGCEVAHTDRTRADRFSPMTASADKWPHARRAKDLVRNMEVEAAIEEIRRRELAGLRSEFSGLTYLASVRDYNSARYYHEGLARRFSEEVMEQALATCHTEVFQRLVRCSVEETVRQLDTYIRATPEPLVNVLYAWTKLEPFRVLMPLNCDQLSADFFVSNVRVALSILQDHVQAADLHTTTLPSYTDKGVNRLTPHGLPEKEEADAPRK